MSSFTKIEKHVESLLGLPIEEIRLLGPGELRAHLEKKNNRKLVFTTEFPVIGRGNVLRDGIIGSEAINKDIEQILSRQ